MIHAVSNWKSSGHVTNLCSRVDGRTPVNGGRSPGTATVVASVPGAVSR